MVRVRPEEVVQGGRLILKPDFPENMDDWPFLWGENEYEISFSAAYIFLVNAVNEMLGANEMPAQ